jgi:anti-sigma factor RsiW
MIALKKPSECALFARLMEPYVDGELDPGHAADMEGHVSDCSLCSERVALVRATRHSLKRTAAHRAPDALRARIQATMAQERPRSRSASRHSDDGQSKSPGMKYVAAVAAAAGVVFAIGLSRSRDTDADVKVGSVREAASDKAAEAAAVGIEAMLDDLVALHKHPLPPETTNPEELQRFEPLVGVPVRRPAFQPFSARFTGARIHALRDRRAALLQYTVGTVGADHRVTVYVFDPRMVPMMRSTALQQRLVRERPVYVGKRGGYSIAAAERSGIGYALATDLDDVASANLVLAAAQQQ